MRPRKRRLGQTLLLVAVVALLLALPGVGTIASQRAAADTPGPSGSCPASNPPNELMLGGGTPQTAQLDTAFDGPLQVALANSNGCPVTSVVGTPVTFTAPSSGASGRFATSGSNTVTVGADVSGNASAPTFTADGTAGGYTVTAISAYGSISFSLTNSAAGIPTTITPTSRAVQSAKTDSSYAQPLSVRVLDVDGNPVPGATVTFTLGATGGGGGGGSGESSAGGSFGDGSAQATATTGSDGTATSPQFTANGTIGSFTATATVANLPAPASFRLENLPGKSQHLTRLGSPKRAATVEQRYRHRLRVLLRDANGAPRAGATVTFTLGSGAGTGAGAGAGASFAGGSSTATATTGIDGIASSPSITAGAVAGTFTATATTSTTTSTAHFTLSNRAGRPATITAGIAAAEATRAGTRFAIALAVTVSDAHGNKVAGALVTFAAPASGASGSFATRTGPRTVSVRTDANGVAVAPAFAANEQPGGYVVIATVAHGPRTAFALVNERS
jgi:protocatechuate 3,4-dioxygenase beta subunit